MHAGENASRPGSPPGIRLQKVLAQAGVASRRKAEDLIRAGLVTVNGEVVTDLGRRVDPAASHIKVAGRRIAPAARKVYLALHKPPGYVTTRRDPQGRPTVMALVRGVREPVFPVGRLDYASEGLLLLTNDGDLAQTVMHPRSGVPKTYRVKVKGHPTDSALDRIRRGIRLEDGPAAPARLARIRRLKANTSLEITLTEGRRREVRRMFDKIGHPVIRLVRVRIGPVRLGTLAPGRIRRLTPAEVAGLLSWSRPRPGRDARKKMV